MLASIYEQISSQILENLYYKDLYERFCAHEQASEELSKISNEIAFLEEQIKFKEQELLSFGFFEKLSKRYSYNLAKDEKKEYESKLVQLSSKKTSLLSLQGEFSESERFIIENYRFFLEGKTVQYDNNVIFEFLVKYFEYDFKKFLHFCKDNGFELDFSNKFDYDFLCFFADYMSMKKLKNSGNKIDSFDDIYLVRRSHGLIAKGDKALSGSKAGIQTTTDYFEYNGKKVECEVSRPLGRVTSHWMMNQEVLPHPDAPEGWSNCDTTTIQPMNQKLYKDALGLNPVDVFFVSDIELDDYFILCNSREAAMNARKLNPNATVLEFSPEHIAGAANLILAACGKFVFYKTYGGSNMEMDRSKYKHEESFDPEFLKQYPDFMEKLGRGPDNLFHDTYEQVAPIYFLVSYLNKMLSIEKDEKSLELSYTNIMQNILNSFAQKTNISFLNKTGLKMRDIFVPLEDGLSDFVDFLIDFDENNFDFEAVFKQLISGVEITKENQDAIIWIKSFLLNEYNKIVVPYKNAEGVKSFHDFQIMLIVTRKLIKNNILEKNVTSEIVADIPLISYDFTAVENLCREIAEQNGSYSEVPNLLPNYLPENLPNIPISQIPNSNANYIVGRIQKINSILNLEERAMAIDDFVLELGFPPEYSSMVADVLNTIKENKNNKKAFASVAQLISIYISNNPNLDYNFESSEISI